MNTTSATFRFDPERHEFSKGDQIIPSVTQVLARAGLCDFSFVEEDVRLHAMDRGRSVHWMLQLEDEGLLDYRRVPRALRPYREAYKTWKQRSEFHVIGIEERFVSPHGFAGIIDRTGSFPATTMYLAGTTAVIDFKTGETPDWVRYQLAAYALGIEPKVALARNIRRIAMSLFADATYKIKEYPLCTFDSDIARFLHELRRTG